MIPIETLIAHWDDQQLAADVRCLLLVAERHGYTVHLFQDRLSVGCDDCKKRRTPSSFICSHDHCKKAYIYSDSHSDFCIAMSHEVGHMMDPQTEADRKMNPNTLTFHTRRMEREHVAWNNAEDILRTRETWNRLEYAFRKRKLECLRAYQIDSNNHGHIVLVPK